MKHPSKAPRTENLEPETIEDEDSEESTLDANDDEPYSDEFLDAFLAEDFEDGDPGSYDFGDVDAFNAEGDAEFDRYFRNADSHSRARRRRRNRGGRSWKDAFEFEPTDGSDWGYSHNRRPRR